MSIVRVILEAVRKLDLSNAPKPYSALLTKAQVAALSEEVTTYQSAQTTSYPGRTRPDWIPESARFVGFVHDVSIYEA